MSNNHLLPVNKEIEQKIKKANKNDQVHIKGYLINYSASTDLIKFGSRNTSLSRDDNVGPAGCEIIYVTDFDIISK